MLSKSIKKVGPLNERLKHVSPHQTVKIFIAAATFLFLTLAVWAVSSPKTADTDGYYHISSIWCGWGEKDGTCEYAAPRVGAEDLEVFIPSMTPQTLAISSMQVGRAALPGQQSAYYKIMRIFVSANSTQSILVIRLFNSLLASVVFFFLLYVNRSRVRLAVVGSWTFTIIPVLISTLPQLNPRSWAFLGVMSSWAFLHSGLSAGHDEIRQKRLSFVFFGITCLLAICTRWDATLFITFTSSVIILGHLFRKQLLHWKYVFLVSIISVIGYFAALTFAPRSAYFLKVEFPPLYSNQQYFLFMFVHIPENIFNAVGLGYRQDDLGPGLIGIIGTSLLVVFVVLTMRNSSKIQASILALYSLMIFFAMFHVMDFGLQPPPGIYIAALLTALLGTITLFSSQNDFLMSTFTQRATIISVLSFSHLLSLYAKFESSVREGVYTGTYEKLSLNGGWWWNTPISPNFVFAIGGLSFVLWLIMSWMTIEQSITNPALVAHSHS